MILIRPHDHTKIFAHNTTTMAPVKRERTDDDQVQPPLSPKQRRINLIREVIDALAGGPCAVKMEELSARDLGYSEGDVKLEVPDDAGAPGPSTLPSASAKSASVSEAEAASESSERMTSSREGDEEGAQSQPQASTSYRDAEGVRWHKCQEEGCDYRAKWPYQVKSHLAN